MRANTTGDAHPDGRVVREVVSYVRRSARMRPNHQRSWDDYRERFVLPIQRSDTSTSVHPGARIDLTAAFGRRAGLIVEVGPGTGDSLIAMALARPDMNILGFEVYQPAVARILGRLAAERIENVRLLDANAAAGLRYLLGESSIDEMWTFFPDPWHKARHHKRRLVGVDFVDLAASRLRRGAAWHLATDWADYAEHMRERLDAHPDLINAHHGWAPRLDARPVTRFEQRGIDAGRRIYDLSYRRV